MTKRIGNNNYGEHCSCTDKVYKNKISTLRYKPSLFLLSLRDAIKEQKFFIYDRSNSIKSSMGLRKQQPPSGETWVGITCDISKSKSKLCNAKITTIFIKCENFYHTLTHLLSNVDREVDDITEAYTP
ncbi:hypothetical protein HZH68_007310 [Vespula germanica]|uniref:Uncharacterized protein n=1 Tax=Vespula germanica TaxID=30212 RepID=A0A834N9A2_VESGE|nr:hypothetical protein HZH68_007310 [Vespula germanica]